MTTNYAKYNNIEYVMPFLFCNDLFIPVLSELFKNEVNPIKYVYGAPSSIWSGGRAIKLVQTRTSTMNAYLQKLKKYNLTAALTFSNYFITDDDIRDELCNQILDIAYENNCHFIVASEKLYNHIKSRYPNAKMVCSVIIPSILRLNGSFNESEFYNKMLNKYDIVVVRPEWTFENIDKIDRLITDVKRIEVLVNQTCIYNCPNTEKHYKLLSEFEHMKIDIETCEKERLKICKALDENHHPLFFDDDVIQKLIDKGITIFKLQGRTYNFDKMYEHIYKYCINQEYSQEEIKTKVDAISAHLIQNKKNSAITLV